MHERFARPHRADSVAEVGIGPPADVATGCGQAVGTHLARVIVLYSIPVRTVMTPSDSKTTDARTVAARASWDVVQDREQMRLKAG